MSGAGNTCKCAFTGECFTVLCLLRRFLSAASLHKPSHEETPMKRVHTALEEACWHRRGKDRSQQEKAEADVENWASAYVASGQPDVYDIHECSMRRTQGGTNLRHCSLSTNHFTPELLRLVQAFCRNYSQANNPMEALHFAGVSSAEDIDLLHAAATGRPWVDVGVYGNRAQRQNAHSPRRCLPRPPSEGLCPFWSTDRIERAMYPYLVCHEKKSVLVDHTVIKTCCWPGFFPGVVICRWLRAGGRAEIFETVSGRLPTRMDLKDRTWAPGHFQSHIQGSCR